MGYSGNSETYQVAQLGKKLSLKESATGELLEVLNGKERELQKSAARRVELTDTVSSLCRDTHRFGMRCNRAKEVCSHAVESAVNRVRKHHESAKTRKVKRPDGRIEDWVRNLVVELVALDGVPTAKVPQVIDRVRHSFTQEAGDEHGEQESNEHNKQGDDSGDKQTISDRSVRRMMVEAYVKAFLYAAKIFGAAPC